MRWQVDEGISTPLLSNGVLYLGTAGAMRALDADSGDTLWVFHLPDGSVQPCFTPSLALGVLYFGTFDTAYSINALTGKQA